MFAPHVETASGIILPDGYLRAVADAVHAAGGLFVLDCIASGAMWVDMKAMGVDVLISAPQKGWSSSACCGARHAGRARATRDRAHDQHELRRATCASGCRSWRRTSAARHAYHATMPTDSLARLRDAMKEIEGFGFAKAKAAQQELGDKVRACLPQRECRASPHRASRRRASSSATPTTRDIQSAGKLAGVGLQAAAGVPLQCDEPADFQTFRIGLFGLDKLRNVERTVENLDVALGQLAVEVQ